MFSCFTYFYIIVTKVSNWDRIEKYKHVTVYRGTDKNKIITTIQDILDNFIGFSKLQNPYGCGDASQQIANYLLNHD